MNPGKNQIEIARGIDRTVPAVSNTLSNMERKKLIFHETDSKGYQIYFERK